MSLFQRIRKTAVSKKTYTGYEDRLHRQRIPSIVYDINDHSVYDEKNYITTTYKHENKSEKGRLTQAIG